LFRYIIVNTQQKGDSKDDENNNNNNNNNNKPEIIIRGNEKGKYMLIDVAISGDKNMIKKGAEKILK